MCGEIEINLNVQSCLFWIYDLIPGSIPCKGLQYIFTTHHTILPLSTFFFKERHSFFNICFWVYSLQCSSFFLKKVSNKTGIKKICLQRKKSTSLICTKVSFPSFCFSFSCWKLSQNWPELSKLKLKTKHKSHKWSIAYTFIAHLLWEILTTKRYSIWNFSHCMGNT